MISLRTKIIISTFFIIFLIITGSYIIIQDIQKSIIEGEFRDKGFLLAHHLALEITNPLLVNDLMGIRNYIDNLKNSYPDIEYVFVTDSGGIVLAHTFEKGFPKALQNRSKPSNVEEESIFSTDKGTIHEFDAPLFQNIGYVHVGLSENRVRAQILDASRNLLFIAISGLLFGGLFIYFIGRRLTEPILNLTEGARRINQGFLEQKIEIDSKDELGVLAATFNEMASSLDRKMKDLVESKEEIMARNRELTVLNEVSRNISATFDLNKILSGTLETLLKLTSMDRGDAYLRDEKSGSFALRIHEGMAGKTAENAVQDKILKRAMRSNEVLIDVSFAAIPIRLKDKVIGIITLGSTQPHRFSARDKEIFSSIGNQLGVAIENITFYNNIKYLKEFNEEILNNVNLAIHVVDRDMKILAINDELLTLGKGRLKKEEIIDKNLFEVYPFLKEKNVNKEYEYVLKTGEIFQSEDRTDYYGDIIYTSTSKIPIKNKSGSVEKIITVMKNVSEQKRLEEELKDSYEELRLTYLKLKELYKIKDTFLSGMSHELRTPLTSIIGYTELLLDRELLPEDRHKLEIILRNSRRLSGLINGLLDTTLIESRGLSLDMRPLSIYDLMENVAEDMRAISSIKNIPIYLDIPQNLVVEGDRDRLTQVFSNILDNAIKFTIKGEINVSAEEENDWVHIRVNDTGIGIPEDKITKIFDRFYQLDSPEVQKNWGTGLGLWISKNIVESHKGKIWAESKNRGSTFHVLLLKGKNNE